jgi:hypothetical protein
LKTSKKKLCRRQWKIFHSRSSKNISSSGSIVEWSEYMVKGCISKVTPLSKL